MTQMTEVHGTSAGADVELQARNLWAGGRFVAAAMAFVFISFVFAFYYLRELNIENKWRPHYVHPPVGFGVAILVCMLISAAIYWVGSRSVTAVSRTPWRIAAPLSLAFAVAALVLVCMDIPRAGFLPTDGAYASVFFGWLGFYAAAVLGGVYYLETLVARLFRYTLPPHPEIEAAQAEGFGVYWTFMALATVLTFILLYVVA